jgi:hypothetical protein
LELHRHASPAGLFPFGSGSVDAKKVRLGNNGVTISKNEARRSL